MKRVAIVSVLIILTFPFDLLPQKVKYVAQGTGTFIKIVPQHFSDDSSPLLDAFVFATPPSIKNHDTVFIGLDSGFYKSNTDNILVVLQKDGHRSKTQLVTDKQIRRNKRRVVLEKTEPLIYRKKEDLFILVEQVDLEVQRKEFKECRYESFEDLEKRNVDYSISSDKNIVIRKTIFRDLMNEYLIKTRYIDPGHSSRTEYLKLKIVITAVTEHNYGGLGLLELRCRIKFSPPLSESEIDKEYVTFSNINYNANNKQLIEEALENAFITMTADPGMRSYFTGAETK